MKNHTRRTEFNLLELSDDPKLQIVIFLFLIITYILSVTGNFTIIILTLVDSHLQTPMYFFLSYVSILEISFTTVCIPRFLGTIITRDKAISYNCTTQLFFFHFLGYHWILSSNCHVLWSLCSYLQTPALHNHHEQQSMCIACLLCLAGRVLKHLPTCYSFSPVRLLWF